jgi:CHAD domain-containing protein
MNSTRYFRLLENLDRFAADPPLTAASGRAPQSLAAVLGKDGRRLRRSVRTAAGLRGTAGADAALHEVRKSAKRLHYAADAASPVDPKAARRLGTSLRRIQKILGRHQDSVVTRELLLRLRAEARASGEDGFAYGLLYGREQSSAEESEAAFRAAWRAFPRKLLR